MSFGLAEYILLNRPTIMLSGEQDAVDTYLGTVSADIRLSLIFSRALLQDNPDLDEDLLELMMKSVNEYQLQDQNKNQIPTNLKIIMESFLMVMLTNTKKYVPIIFKLIQPHPYISNQIQNYIGKNQLTMLLLLIHEIYLHKNVQNYQNLCQLVVNQKIFDTVGDFRNSVWDDKYL